MLPIMTLTAGATTSHAHDGVTFDTEWTAKRGTISSSKNYYLNTDIEATSFIEIGDGENECVVNLCLNGHTLDMLDKEFSINPNATLNIYDCSSNSGKLTGTYRLGTIRVYGKLNIYGGTVTNTATGDASSYNYAIVNGIYNNTYYGSTDIFGGVISAEKAIYNTQNCSLNISGANTQIVATTSNGIVNIGSLTMTDGSVVSDDSYGIHNTCNYNKTKCGVSVITGGKISSVNSSAIYNDTKCELNVSGGTEISGSKNYGIDNEGGYIYLFGAPEISGDDTNYADICSNGGMITAQSIDGSTSYSGGAVSVEVGGASFSVDTVIIYNVTDSNKDKFSVTNSGYTLEPSGDHLILAIPHTHSWEYSISADGKTITAECIGTYTCTYEGTDKSITITAPRMEVYGDGNSANATLSESSLAGQTTLPAVKYIGRDSTIYEESTTAPTNAGKYTASITIDSITAKVDYEITKATLTDVSWPVGLSGNAGEMLSTIELPEGFTWQQPNKFIDYECKEYVMCYQPDEQNYYTAMESVQVEAIDDKAPTGTISIGDKQWSSFIGADDISFNSFFNTTQAVEITAEDEKYGSGIDYDDFQYYISTEPKSMNQLANMAYSSWKEYTGEFDITPNCECIIYVRFQDYGNNMTYLSSNGIVLDNKAPVISGITDGGVYCGDTEVTVSDDYFDRVELDGVETTVTDGKFTVKPASGTQEIIAYDKAGNTTTYIVTVTVTETMICEHSVKGSGTSYEYSFEMASPDEIKGTFIVALYGEGNRLVGMKIITMDADSRTYSEAMEITADSTANKYKIMFWSGLDTLIPLCVHAEGEIVIL